MLHPIQFKDKENMAIGQDNKDKDRGYDYTWYDYAERSSDAKYPSWVDAAPNLQTYLNAINKSQPIIQCQYELLWSRWPRAKFFSKGITIPGISVQTQDLNHAGFTIKIPTHVTYETTDITLNIIADKEGFHYYDLRNMVLQTGHPLVAGDPKSTIGNPYGISPNEDTIEVRLRNSPEWDETHHHWIIHNFKPIELGDIELSQDSGSFVEFELKGTFTHISYDCGKTLPPEEETFGFPPSETPEKNPNEDEGDEEEDSSESEVIDSTESNLEEDEYYEDEEYWYDEDAEFDDSEEGEEHDDEFYDQFIDEYDDEDYSDDEWEDWNNEDWGYDGDDPMELTVECQTDTIKANGEDIKLECISAIQSASNETQEVQDASNKFLNGQRAASSEMKESMQEMVASSDASSDKTIVKKEGGTITISGMSVDEALAFHKTMASRSESRMDDKKLNPLQRKMAERQYELHQRLVNQLQSKREIKDTQVEKLNNGQKRQLNSLISAIKYNRELKHGNFKVTVNPMEEMEKYKERTVKLSLPQRFGMYKTPTKDVPKYTSIELEDPPFFADSTSSRLARNPNHKIRSIFD